VVTLDEFVVQNSFGDTWTLAPPAGWSLFATDYDVLSTLTDAEEHRARLTALAMRMLWSKSRLSRHIGRMAERGLVVRVEDGRRADVLLTEKGKQAMFETAPKHVESVREHFIDLLTEEQLRVLGDVAEAVLARLPRPASDVM
jgi:DNA-binding MarR family transcriptional regulator